MFKTLSSFSALFCLTCYAVIAVGAEVPTCKEEEMEAGREGVMNIMECLQEVNVNHYKEVPAEKMACFARCFLLKKGMIDETGMAKNENIMAVIKEAIPTADFADALAEKLQKCVADNGANLQTSGDDCDSFNPLMECFHMSFTEVCKA